ncbi:MAG: phosphotransferase [Alphaproteobacteria bacterium]|nr:phosphotransferase [Alphaproteobacteria bacterium]
MTSRDATLSTFLEVNGQGRALRKRLAGDASVRRYERLIGGPVPMVLMDCPPDLLDVGPFLCIAKWLRRCGFSAPLIFAADEEAGLALMEDLGDDLFNRVLSEGVRSVDETELYGAAVDVLVVLQALEPPDDLPAYDDDKMLEEVGRFTRWYASRLSERAKADFLDIWRELLPLVRVGPAAFVYVDYHADNLLWLPEREGLARVGLLDFQDGRLGPPAYDLVSLLEDARRDVPPALAEAMVERYLAARPDLDAEAFRVAYAVLGAQRNCKILGLFSRLAIEDGKTQYLALQDRVRVHLQRDLAHPSLAALATWFDDHLLLNIAS